MKIDSKLHVRQKVGERDRWNGRGEREGGRRKGGGGEREREVT